MENIIGRRFGKLTVLEFAPPKKHKNIYLICKCDCGRTKQIPLTFLKDGRVSSCGCDIDKRNIIGKKFGSLTVLERIKLNGRYFYCCKCECGKIINVRCDSLLDGNVRSCGCKQHELLKKANGKHNLSRTRIQKIYAGMINRCYLPSCPSYKNYGAKGITVCDEWRGENGLVNFCNWAIKNGYEEDILPNGRNRVTIDRINNNGNYEPQNCRWVDMKTQLNNYSKNVCVEYNGETYTLTQLSEKYNIEFSTLSRRYKKYKDIKKAIETPIQVNMRRYYKRTQKSKESES